MANKRMWSYEEVVEKIKENGGGGSGGGLTPPQEETLKNIRAGTITNEYADKTYSYCITPFMYYDNKEEEENSQILYKIDTGILDVSSMMPSFNFSSSMTLSTKKDINNWTDEDILNYITHPSLLFYSITDNETWLGGIYSYSDGNKLGFEAKQTQVGIYSNWSGQEYGFAYISVSIEGTIELNQAKEILMQSQSGSINDYYTWTEDGPIISGNLKIDGTLTTEADSKLNLSNNIVQITQSNLTIPADGTMDIEITNEGNFVLVNCSLGTPQASCMASIYIDQDGHQELQIRNTSGSSQTGVVAKLLRIA